MSQNPNQNQYQKRRRYRGNNQRRGDSPRPSRPTPQAAPPTFAEKLKSFFTFGWLRKSAEAKPTESTPTSRPPRRELSRQREKPVFKRPDPADVTSERLYVGNLSYDATESDLFELFNGVGTAQNAEVVTNSHTHRSKGYAFVQMRSIEEARRAVEVLHDQEFMGRKLIVSAARPPSGEHGGDRDERAA
jgi:RNA recognition motif-containing protein